MIRSNVVLIAAVMAGVGQSDASAAKFEVQSVRLTLIEQVEVPAREAGVLSALWVREGQSVVDETLLALIEDHEAQLSKNRAELNLEIARKQADNDIRIRVAKKTAEVAKAELARALESRKAVRDSVSQSEIDSLQLMYDRSLLEIEQAERDLEIAGVNRRVKENELEFTIRNVERRRITSPISGVVVKIYRRRGEWVEPGDKVIRILRMDRLRAEGFINANDASNIMNGSHVTLRLPPSVKTSAVHVGKIVFVSPEVELDGKVRIWAEIDNRDLMLRPGLRGSLSIDTTVYKASQPQPK